MVTLKRNPRNLELRHKFSKKRAIPRFSEASSKFRGKRRIPQHGKKIHVLRNTAGPADYEGGLETLVLASSADQKLRSCSRSSSCRAWSWSWY